MPSVNAQRLQQHDWARTGLGHPDGWPVEMKTAISMLMASDFPMCSVWGDRQIQIYNDAYNPIYGAKHPASFGASACDSWTEIWEFLGPALDQVTATGEALWFADTLLPLVRVSEPEECYFDFSYSPIRDVGGAIIGILSVVAERTSEVILRRRQNLAKLDAARDAEDTFAVLTRTLHDVLEANEMDCAKAILYSVAPETGAPDGEIWSLRASRGFVRATRPLAARALRRGSVVLDRTGEVDGGHVLSIPFCSMDGDARCVLVISPNDLVPLEISALPFAQAISTRFHAALHAAELRQREIGQMHDQIVEQELLYRFLFNNMQDGVTYCATTGVPTDDEIILAVNPQLCALLGYSADELIGMSRDAITFPDDAALKAALETRGRDLTFTSELTLRGKDGQVVPVEVSSNLIEFRKGETRSLSIIRDISRRREIEEQQAERVRLETVANLAGTLAHDTNNLMTIIIGGAEYLSDRLLVGSVERQMALNAMAAAERASGLTNQLLLYAGQHPLAARAMDLNAFVNEIRPLIASALGEINTLAVTPAADLPPCMADPAQLTTAFLNLVTNARQAMPDGGTLTVETFLEDASDEQGQPFVGLRVRDSGTGISPDIQSRVFEPFFTTKEVGSGSGLGLSIVRRLMEELGGTLRMTSTPGNGTVFDLGFRLAEAATQDGELEALADRPHGETVLYVEDNENVRHHTEAMLRKIGVDPVAFGTGREALDWVRHGGRAALLFTDLVLPGGMSGLELATALRRDQPQLPVLITTGYDPRASLAEEHGRHFPVLRKPYTSRALAAALLRELGTPA